MPVGLERGLLLNITELHSMSRISHTSQAVQHSMKILGMDIHVYIQT